MNKRFSDLIEELRSRHVIRAMIAYCVVAWMLLQVADVTFDRLPIPEYSMTVLIVLVIIGLPVTAVLAWAYDITLRGVVRHEKTHGEVPKLAFLPFIVLLVGVTAIVGTGLYYLSLRYWEPEPKSIAVLPFINLSDSEDTEYFSDGLTEELRNLIVRLGEFRVVSLSSTYRLKDTTLDYRTIARRLDVDVILHGSVRRATDRARIAAKLIDGDDGIEVLSERYDVSLADVFSTQENIARKVASALDVVVSTSQESRLARLGTRNVEAYDLYLRGIDHLRKSGDTATLSKAEFYIRQAIAIDPQFASAYAAMCESHLAHYELHRDSERFVQAEQACHRALTRDSESSDVHVALGRLYFSGGQYQDSVRQFEQALAANTRSAEAHIGLGKTLLELNRIAEAEASLQRAIELDPSYWAGFKEMGNFLLANGRFLEAAEYYSNFATRTEDSATAYNNLGAANFLAGDFSAAAQAWDQSLELRPTRSAYSNTGTMYFYLGDYAKAADRFARAASYAPRDHRLWGNLADAYYYTDGMRHVADVIYQEAIEFAEERARVNPADMETVAILCHFYARIGKDDLARQRCETALASAPDDMYVQYYSALAFAHLGDTVRALGRIERAIELDYQRELLELDPGLVSLKDEARFRELISRNDL